MSPRIIPGCRVVASGKTNSFGRLGIGALALLALGAAVALPASAQETTSYTYDALGRLQSSVISGGPNTGITSSTTFDAAGNRTNYSVTGVGGPPEITCQISGSNSYSYGGWPISMMIMRKGNCPAGQQVGYTTVDGTGPYAGQAGVDYIATSGTKIFANAYNNSSQWSYNEVSFTVNATQSPSDMKVFGVQITSINLGAETEILGGAQGQFLPPD